MNTRAKDEFRTRLPTNPDRGPPFQRISPRQMLAISVFWCFTIGLLSVHISVAEPPDAVGSQDRWKTLGNGVLEDGRTMLQWLQDDNGGDIDWNDARSYCEGKHDGWRLPSLRELKTIYNEQERGVKCAQTICRVSSKFHVTGTWFWSATQVGKDATDGIELAWGVLMTNGAQTQTVREASYGSRALCVRGR
jgi:Protein of unknown function (DUF1566)